MTIKMTTKTTVKDHPQIRDKLHEARGKHENMNTHNLRRPTHTEAVERGRKGGKKSGEVRRERKLLKECLDEILQLPVSLTERQILDKMKAYGISESDRTLIMALAMSLVDKAIHGDLKSATFIRDTIGEKPELQVRTTSTTHSQSKIIIYNSDQR